MPGAPQKYKYKYTTTYNDKVHANVDKLLKQYSTNGKIGLRPITLPGAWQYFCIS